jgi:hypothetical protein
LPCLPASNQRRRRIFCAPLQFSRISDRRVEGLRRDRFAMQQVPIRFEPMHLTC